MRDIENLLDRILVIKWDIYMYVIVAQSKISQIY